MDTSFILIGLQQALSLQNIFLIALGAAIGIIVGALPGLSATMALALLLPITFPLALDSGLAMLAALYLSAMYGGSIAAIILRTPGTPAAAATVMDGYPLGARGEAGKALGNRPRSEEHTSELESRCHLVCRLLVDNTDNSCVHDCFFLSII